MKASELRIGNWVSWLDGSDDFEATTTIISHCDAYKPIPLNEEWLLKFSFEEDEEWSGYKFQYMRMTFILVPPDETTDVWDVYVEFDVACGFELLKYVRAQHVHTIQNLIFSLTEEELTIKQLP